MTSPAAMAKQTVPIESWDETLGITRLSDLQMIGRISSKLNISPVNAARGVYVLLCGISLLPSFRGVGFFISTLLVPAIYSIKSLDADIDYDPKHWLSYWLIYSFWLICDDVMSAVLGFLPLYFLVRNFTMIYLYVNKQYGAGFLYKKFLEPAYQIVFTHAIQPILVFEEFTNMLGTVGQTKKS